MLNSKGEMNTREMSYVLFLAIIILVIMQLGGLFLIGTAMQFFFGLALALIMSFVILRIYNFKTEPSVIAFDMGGVIADGDASLYDYKEKESMRSLINKLKKDHKVVLLSNQSQQMYNLVFNKEFGLDKLFHDKIISGEVGVKKPDAGIYQAAVDKFNVKPERMIFIDDMPDNVEAARAQGINAIQFTNKEQLKKDLKKFGIDV